MILVNVGSGNGLSPADTKPLAWTNIDLPSVWSTDINLMVISQKMLEASITQINLTKTYLKFISNLPGAHGLNTWSSTI